MAKNLFASKTLWVNFLTFMLGLITLISQQAWIASNPQYVGYATVALAAVNFVLRLWTHTPIEGSPGDKST